MGLFPDVEDMYCKISIQNLCFYRWWFGRWFGGLQHGDNAQKVFWRYINEKWQTENNSYLCDWLFVTFPPCDNTLQLSVFMHLCQSCLYLNLSVQHFCKGLQNRPHICNAKRREIDKLAMPSYLILLVCAFEPVISATGCSMFAYCENGAAC